jgi:hypothetical protein
MIVIEKQSRRIFERIDFVSEGQKSIPFAEKRQIQIESDVDEGNYKANKEMISIVFIYRIKNMKAMEALIF